MSVWICLVRQPAELRRTALPETGDPPSVADGGVAIYFWLGMALLCLGCGMLWLSVLQFSQHRLSDAESELRLGYPRGLGHLA